MSCNVPRYVFPDAALLRNCLDAVLAIGIARHGKQLGCTFLLRISAIRTRSIALGLASVLLHFEEQLEIGDERRSKLFKGNIADFVPLLDELREVLVNDAVFPIAAQAFEFAYLLFVILVVLSEYGNQRFMVHAQPQIGVADFLGGYIVVAVGDLLIGSVDAHADFIQHPVGLLRNNTTTPHAA